MYQFIETIRMEHGEALLLPLHEKRLNATRLHFFGDCKPLQLKDYIHWDEASKGVTKCRILYDASGICQVTYTPYHIRQVATLRLVRNDEIDYTYKSTDRSALNHCFEQRGEADEVLIVRRGLLTDTSIANIALWDGMQWVTPLHPLLCGVRRQSLLLNGTISARDVTADEWGNFDRIRLFNGMIEWGELEISIPHK